MSKKLTGREMTAHKRKMAKMFRDKNPEKVFKLMDNVETGHAPSLP